jgi:hypothetical protein
MISVCGGADLCVCVGCVALLLCLSVYWTTSGQAIQEATYADASNYMNLQFSLKGSNAAIDSYTCPTTVIASQHIHWTHNHSISRVLPDSPSLC